MAHQGKTVLVTGAGGGLGRAVAETFVEAGANVVVCDINHDRLADFEAKVGQASEGRTLAIACDITSEPALDDLFAQAERKFGAFDCVVNAAGIMDHFDPVGEVDRAVWDRVLAVNLTAPYLITKRAVNGFLQAKKKGSIVNIASIASIKGWAAGAAYTASKTGLIGLTRSTAAYYRSQGIRCNAIQAGAMATNISDPIAQRVHKAGLDLNVEVFGGWKDGFLEVPKMAHLVQYLCSDEASIINGAMLTADGGMTVLH